MKLQNVLILIEKYSMFPGDHDPDERDKDWQEREQLWLKMGVEPDNLTKIPTLKPEFQDAIEQRRKANPNRKHVGSGAFTYVDQDQSPHEMDTVTRVHSMRDGGSIYYQAIIDDPELADNPMLPKIKAHRAGEYTEFDTEKLYPLGVADENSEMLSALLRQAIPNESNWVFSADRMNLKRFVYELDLAIKAYDTDVLSPNLAQAAKLIHTLANNNGRRLDLHAGNYMVRMTGTMPQLVIVDPLADNFKK